MLSKIYKWTTTLLGKVITTVVGLVDYIIKWKMYAYLLMLTETRLMPVLSASTTIPKYLLVILIAIVVLCIFLFLYNIFKKERYFIPIRSCFHTGFEPTAYDNQTRWSYKQEGAYYFVPLLSHGYDYVNFADLCGPYCSKCNHILHLNSDGDMGNKFFCVNCVKTYKIPKELLGDYENKLLSYFRAEYSQGRLKSAN